MQISRATYGGSSTKGCHGRPYWGLRDYDHRRRSASSHVSSSAEHRKTVWCLIRSPSAGTVASSPSSCSATGAELRGLQSRLCRDDRSSGIRQGGSAMINASAKSLGSTMSPTDNEIKRTASPMAGGNLIRRAVSSRKGEVAHERSIEDVELKCRACGIYAQWSRLRRRLPRDLSHGRHRRQIALQTAPGGWTRRSSVTCQIR